MYQIRKYEERDYGGVEQVCIGLSDEKLRGDELFRSALLDVFCHYYIEQEPENCFVVADETDEVRGYIVCACNFETYATVFQDAYLKSDNPVTKMMGTAAMEAMKAFAAEYPAHLHIDMYPECQGQGVGRQLIETLVRHLYRKGVKGLMLDVSADNEGARVFYEKCGFRVLRSSEQEILMGMKIMEAIRHEG